MGFGEAVSRSAIRVSLGPATTEDEISRFAAVWVEAHARHQARAA
jgi:cysteine desulfurase